MSGYTAATMAVVSLASTALGAVSTIQSSKAQEAQADYQSDIADYNAKVAEGNAQMAEAEGKAIKKQAYEDSLTKRQEAVQIIGKQRAQQAASGIAVDSGSALDLNLDTAEKGELDALAIREQGAYADYNKRLEAWNFRSQASGLNTQSQMYSNQADSYNPLYSAGGTLLSGVAQAGSNYHMMTKKS